MIGWVDLHLRLRWMYLHRVWTWTSSSLRTGWTVVGGSHICRGSIWGLSQFVSLMLFSVRSPFDAPGRKLWLFHFVTWIAYNLTFPDQQWSDFEYQGFSWCSFQKILWNAKGNMNQWRTVSEGVPDIDLERVWNVWKTRLTPPDSHSLILFEVNRSYAFGHGEGLQFLASPRRWNRSENPVLTASGLHYEQVRRWIDSWSSVCRWIRLADSTRTCIKRSLGGFKPKSETRCAALAMCLASRAQYRQTPHSSLSFREAMQLLNITEAEIESNSDPVCNK